MVISRICDAAAMVILGLLLLFMPVAIGVVEPLTEEIFVASACVMMLLAWVGLILRGGALSLHPVLIVIVLFLSPVPFQLIPLSAGVLALISPETVPLNQKWVGDIPDSAARLARLP